MTPDQIEAERVRFEAWYRQKYVRNVLHRSSVDGTYDSGSVFCSWQGWLARAEEQCASEAAAEELMERQEPQRLAMEAKHMGSNGVK